MHSRKASRKLATLLIAFGWAAASAAAQQAKPPAKPPLRPAPAKPAPAKPAAPAPEGPQPPPPSDLVVKMQYVSGDKTTTSVVSAKGKRERVDYGSEMSVVTQCDTGQMIQIADATKRYLVSPIDPAEAQTKKKGGVVTYTTAV